ncbi:MAG TPA: hypothetical protein VFA55_03170 [Candidatus Kapabacteria bacterium]|nr:hypothetical protein [Candidatus Kapabacteria bacterium]
MKKSAVLVLLLLIVGCQKKTVVDEKTFVGAYAHIFLIKSSTTDSVAAAAQVSKLLGDLHITKEQMQEQLKIYSDDPETYRRVLQEIDDTLKTLEK